MKYLLPSLILSLAIFAAGCTKTSSSKQMAIYTSLEESVAQKIAEEFQKDTGIKLDFVRLATGEATARIEAEKNNPQAALWLGGVGIGHAELKAKGLTSPYSSATTAKIPASLKDPENFWNGLYRGILVFVANQNQLKSKNLQSPQKWADLLDSKWKGAIQIPNPGTSGTSYNLLTAFIQSMGEDKAFDYMKALHKNISQYTKSGMAPTKNVAIGESILAVGYFHDVIRLKEESKAPLEISFPQDGTGYEVSAVSLIKGGPKQELATQLIEWMYTAKASQILADGYYVPIFQDGVQLKNEAIIPKNLKLIDVNMDWAGRNKERLINLWNSKVNT